MSVDHWMLLGPLGAAAIYDMRFRKIPNYLILSTVFGMVLRRGLQGISAMEPPCVGGLLFFVTYAAFFLLLQPLFLFRLCGGGDVKLMAVILAWLPLERSCTLLLIASMLVLLYHFFRGKSQVPFAVFLFLGALPCLIFAEGQSGVI